MSTLSGFLRFRRIADADYEKDAPAAGPLPPPAEAVCALLLAAYEGRIDAALEGVDLDALIQAWFPELSYQDLVRREQVLAETRRQLRDDWFPGFRTVVDLLPRGPESVRNLLLCSLDREQAEVRLPFGFRFLLQKRAERWRVTYIEQLGGP